MYSSMGAPNRHVRISFHLKLSPLNLQFSTPHSVFSQIAYHMGPCCGFLVLQYGCLSRLRERSFKARSHTPSPVSLEKLGKGGMYSPCWPYTLPNKIVVSIYVLFFIPHEQPARGNLNANNPTHPYKLLVSMSTSIVF